MIRPLHIARRCRDPESTRCSVRTDGTQCFVPGCRRFFFPSNFAMPD